MTTLKDLDFEHECGNYYEDCIYTPACKKQMMGKLRSWALELNQQDQLELERMGKNCKRCALTYRNKYCRDCDKKYSGILGRVAGRVRDFGLEENEVKQ